MVEKVVKQRNKGSEAIKESVISKHIMISKVVRDWPARAIPLS